jgi:hypothetical protein
VGVAGEGGIALAVGESGEQPFCYELMQIASQWLRGAWRRAAGSGSMVWAQRAWPGRDGREWRGNPQGRLGTSDLVGTRRHIRTLRRGPFFRWWRDRGNVGVRESDA